jgi:hypothetical protein
MSDGPGSTICKQHWRDDPLRQLRPHFQPSSDPALLRTSLLVSRYDHHFSSSPLLTRHLESYSCSHPADDCSRTRPAGPNTPYDYSYTAIHQNDALHDIQTAIKNLREFIGRHGSIQQCAITSIDQTGQANPYKLESL